VGHGHHRATALNLGDAGRLRWVLAAVIVPLAIATVVGLLVLWPSGDVALAEHHTKVDRARGTLVDIGSCEREVQGCLAGTVRLESGPGAPGEVTALLPYGERAPEVRVGDDLILTYASEAPEGERYAFQEHDRTTSLTLLLVVFAVSVLLLSRWRGLGSLASLAFSLVLIVVFTLPAVMEGSPPLAVAVVTAAAIMLVTLYLSHGINAPTSVAMIGTLAALVVIGALGSFFTTLGRFTGLMDEGSQYISSVATQVDIRGLLLAGLVIGALGVLDDVTVTQTWAVWELADADPEATPASLFLRAMRIGRSHVASTVNTLVLAYVGATLPLLLVFSVMDLPFAVAVSQEVVAQEVVRGLVGGLGIVAAVPITTAIAAFVAGRLVAGRHAADRPDEAV
jgi:uncharacterized membrane protein